MFTSQKISKFFLVCFFFLFFSQSIYALFFDRRTNSSTPSLSYFFFPLVGNIPGVQSFYGIGGTISSIKESDIDITVISILGEANENFEKLGNDNDFRLNIFSITDLPLSRLYRDSNDSLTLSLYYGEGSNVSAAQRKRGIDSKKDEFNFILLNKFGFRGLQVSKYFFQGQLEIYYTFAEGSAEPLGFIINEGGQKRFIKNEDANVSDRGDGGRYGIYLDDTDNRRDPRIGYRVKYERYNLPTSRGEAPAYYQDDYNITGYIPFNTTKKLVLVLNQFYASATVTKEGKVNPDNYDCSKNKFDNCIQTNQDKRRERAIEESRLGNATSLGGVLRLRGYPTVRFFDSYTNFQGMELRWYLFEKERVFDVIFEKGIQTSWQFAFFYEQGTVARTPGALWNNLKNSYGFGVRSIFTSVVLRADFGFSEEGRETSIFVGYPF